LVFSGLGSQAEELLPALLTGIVLDTQGQPVAEAEVTLRSGQAPPIAEAITQSNGRYALGLPGLFPDDLAVHIERAHFAENSINVSAEAVEALRAGQSVVMPDTILPRRVSAAFCIATLVFAAVLVLIATGRLHNTLAALLGASVIFAVSYLGHSIMEDLFVFGFETALGYVDWNVIFLVMGMMIVIAVVERTGIFQWLAYQAYRLSRGRLWLLLPILMSVTGVASAFLDNVTTMLLMTPITVQIAMAMSINPLAPLLPAVMASNVVGVSTLVGTPTNILVGSFSGISFNGFLVNLTPGVLLALLGLIVYSEAIYRRELRAGGGGHSRPCY
jgi:di/tricarboxylate transporter